MNALQRKTCGLASRRVSLLMIRIYGTIALFLLFYFSAGQA